MLIKKVGALFFVFSLCLNCWGQCDITKYEELINKGFDYAARDEYAMALKKFNAAKLLCPENASKVDLLITNLFTKIQNKVETANKLHEQTEAFKTALLMLQDANNKKNTDPIGALKLYKTAYDTSQYIDYFKTSLFDFYNSFEYFYKLVTVNEDILNRGVNFQNIIPQFSFSNDGSKILKIIDNNPTLWDVFKDTLISDFKVEIPKALESALLTNDGNSIVMAEYGMPIKLLNIKTKEVTSTKNNVQFFIKSMQLSEDDNMLLIRTQNDTLRVLNLSTSESKTFPRDTQFNINFNSISEISPDGKTVFIGCDDSSLLIWKIATNEIIKCNVPIFDILDFSFNTMGNTFTTGDRTGWVKTWDLEGNLIESTYTLEYDFNEPDIQNMILSEKGITLICNSDNTMLVAKKGETPKPLNITFKNSPRLDAVKIIDESSFITVHTPRYYGYGMYAAKIKSEVRLWKKKEEKVQKTSVNQQVNQVKFLSENKKFIYVPQQVDFEGNSLEIPDSIAILCNAQTGDSITCFRGHHGSILSMAISSDNKYVLTGSNDNSAILWDTNGRLLKRFNDHLSPVQSVAFSIDDEQILTGSKDTILLRGIDGNAKRLFQSHGQEGNIGLYVKFSPDGNTFVSSANVGAILWSTNGSILKRYKHADCLEEIYQENSLPVYSYDGKTILVNSCSELSNNIIVYNIDGTIKYNYTDNVLEKIKTSAFPDELDMKIFNNYISTDGQFIIFRVGGEGDMGVAGDAIYNQKGEFIQLFKDIEVTPVYYDFESSSLSFSSDSKLIYYFEDSTIYKIQNNSVPETLNNIQDLISFFPESHTHFYKMTYRKPKTNSSPKPPSARNSR